MQENQDLTSLWEDLSLLAADAKHLQLTINFSCRRTACNSDRVILGSFLGGLHTAVNLDNRFQPCQSMTRLQNGSFDEC